MSQNKQLFENDSDEDEDAPLKINTSYASKYGEWRRAEEIQKLKDRYGEDGDLTSESESSSDDDFVEPDNPAFDRDFLLTLGALKKRDEKQLESNKFFTGDYSLKKNEEKEEEKPMLLRDYERHIIFDREGQVEEDEVDDGKLIRDKDTLTNQKIKFEDDSDASSDDGDDLFTSGLFTKKKDPEKAEEEENSKHQKTGDDVIAFMKGNDATVSNPEDRELLTGLRSAWNDPSLSKKDKWLTDFFLNKRYLEDDDELIEKAYNEVVIDEETLSEDEKTLEKMEVFETKYRFRFEEPDEEFIKRYPRTIPESIRAKDEKRKEKREALKKRKQEEKEEKRQEIEKLKAFKYKEIEEKIRKIKEASGNDDIDLGDRDVDGDFDPAAHDSAMTRMFGSDYYAGTDGDEKPVFSDDEDVIRDYDDWLEKQGPGAAGGGTVDAEDGWGNEGEEEDGGIEEWPDWNEEQDFNMDADYDPGQSKEELQQEMVKSSSKHKGHRKSKFAKALKRGKPVFNPIEKDFESYFDEYYKLDFEDIVGGMPCRFKYRTVERNDFGLSTEEILSAQDRELNRWYSVKKMLKYDRSHEEEVKDQCMYRRRSSQTHVKQKILPSLFAESPEEVQIREQEKKRQKNLKKKLRRQQRMQGIQAGNGEPEMTGNIEPPKENMTSKSKKRVLDDEITEDPINSLTTSEGDFSPSKKKSKKVKKLSNDSAELMASSTKVQAETSEFETKLPETTENLSAFVASPKKRKKKKKSKENQQHSVIFGSVDKKNWQEKQHHYAHVDKKKKKKKLGGGNSEFMGLTDARLEAYGQNPKKFKNKVKYGKNKNVT